MSWDMVDERLLRRWPILGAYAFDWGVVLVIGLGALAFASRKGGRAAGPTVQELIDRRISRQREAALSRVQTAAYRLDEVMNQLQAEAEGVLGSAQDARLNSLLRHVVIAGYESRALTDEIQALIGASQQPSFGGELPLPGPNAPAKPHTAAHQ